MRAAPVLGPWKETIRSWLEADLEVPRKQRHTARRVWERLVAEHGAQIGESTVRRFVAEARAELGSGGLLMAMVPQTHVLGEEAEVDFGEFWAWLAGVRTRLWLFVMRLSGSGKAFHHVFGNECGESFYQGHNLAFDYFGGVPSTIRYDNLKAAVVKVLLGRQRWENPKFVALRSHYGFESFFCLPGEDGAHEKGGVEGEIGRFRRRHLVPLPRVESLDELHTFVAAADVIDDERVIAGRPLVDGRRVTVGEHFALEQPLLQPLPDGWFDTTVDLECRVDTKARVCVRQAFYSVPVRLIGSKIRVRLGASSLEAFDGATLVARHERSLHKGTESLMLDHYLEILVRKPGALPTVREQAGKQADAAARAQLTHRGYLAELLATEVDDRAERRRIRRIREARFPRLPPRSRPSPPGSSSTTEPPSCSSAIPAPAKPTSSSAPASPHATPATASATSPPLASSTNSSKLNTNTPLPASSPATDATTSSSSTNSATSTSTTAVPNSSSKSSQNETNEPPSPWPPTHHSPNGPTGLPPKPWRVSDYGSSLARRSVGLACEIGFHAARSALSSLVAVRSARSCS